MAINFPDSPSLNQEFQVGDRVWFWNGTVWKSKETPVLETGKYIVSETAPENPEEGDAWLDSVNVKEFIYYDGFWVETSAAAVGLPADNYATEQYVDLSISNLINAAPTQLDTLQELSNALNNDENFATTINNLIDTKSPINAPSFTGNIIIEGTATVSNGTVQITTGDIVLDGTSVSTELSNLSTSVGANTLSISQNTADISTNSAELLNKKNEIVSEISTNTSAQAGYRYFVDTSTGVTLTLPASPSVGDEVQVFDSTGNAETNNILVNRNGQNINGIADNALLDVNGVAAVFVYTGATYGWRLG